MIGVQKAKFVNERQRCATAGVKSPSFPLCQRGIKSSEDPSLKKRGRGDFLRGLLIRLN
jgi:hypothetical protein